MRAYMIRVEVEFRQEGHIVQHSEQAAEEQQQASWPTVHRDSRAPIPGLKYNAKICQLVSQSEYTQRLYSLLVVGFFEGNDCDCE